MKDKTLIISVVLNIMLVIMSMISIIFWKDCYNRMNELEKELQEKNHEVEVLKDRTRLLEEDVNACDWYIRFYDEFHEEVGAFE